MAELVRIAHDAHGLDPALDDIHREHAQDPDLSLLLRNGPNRSAAGGVSGALHERGELLRVEVARLQERQRLLGREPLGSMQQLTTGSVICFGSTISGRFCLDTVFVVAAAQPWSPADAEEVRADDAFVICTARAVATSSRDASRSFTLYRGTTYEDPIDGMFSFVLASRADSLNRRFERPAIELPGLINPAARRARAARVARLLDGSSGRLDGAVPPSLRTEARARGLPGNPRAEDRRREDRGDDASALLSVGLTAGRDRSAVMGAPTRLRYPNVPAQLHSSAREAGRRCSHSSEAVVQTRRQVDADSARRRWRGSCRDLVAVTMV
jgi:hypothetical protein